MTNDSIILAENDNPFSPISQLHYNYYTDPKILQEQLEEDKNIQCIVGLNGIEFGKSQMPSLFNYADGIDTMQFLLSL